MTYKRGESGNYKGRPPGSKNKHTQLAMLLEPHAEPLIQKVVEMAKNGDIQALRLCIERLIPKATQRTVSLDIESTKLTNNEYLLAFNQQVIEKTANGEISPNESSALLSLTDNQRKLLESLELKRKLDEIEKCLSEK